MVNKYENDEAERSCESCGSTDQTILEGSSESYLCAICVITSLADRLSNESAIKIIKIIEKDVGIEYLDSHRFY